MFSSGLHHVILFSPLALLQRWNSRIRYRMFDGTEGPP